MADAKTADVAEDVVAVEEGVEAESDASNESEDEQIESSVAGVDFAVSRVVARLQRLGSDADPDNDPDDEAANEPGLPGDEDGPRDWLQLLLGMLREDGPVAEATPPKEPEPSLVAVAVATWAARLEAGQVARLTRRVAADTTRWIGRLCRWPGASCFLCPSEPAAMATLLRLVLSSVAPDDKLPVVYAHPEHLWLVQRACAQLSLPALCARSLPADTQVDLAALEQQVSSDSLTLRPLVLVVSPGNGVSLATCQRLGLWLHLRGPALAARVAATTEATECDSCSLPLSHWLAVPGLDHAIVHRPMAREEELEEAEPGPLIGWLPVWAELAARGGQAAEERVRAAVARAADVSARLAQMPHLQLLSEGGGAEVVFRFAAGDDHQLDRLNTWLGQMLARDCPLANVATLLVSGRVWLRHCPLECRVPRRWLPELRAQLEILAATATLSPAFRRLANASDRLSLVDVPGWAGLGGVVYGSANQTPDQCDRLNAALVDKLRQTDSAFSLGETAEGRLCVRFAMVTHDTDVAELLSLVETTGQQVEDAAEALTNMADIVKKGIEEATLELQKEAEQRVWQQGVLRQVPVVGSLLNWWSPSSGGDASKGRCLDLAAGGVVTPTTHLASQ